jgi:hypothetical protein
MSSAEDRSTAHTHSYQCPRCDADVLPVPQRCGFIDRGATVPRTCKFGHTHDTIDDAHACNERDVLGHSGQAWARNVSSVDGVPFLTRRQANAILWARTARSDYR